MLHKMMMVAIAASIAGAALAQNEAAVRIQSNGFITQAIGEMSGKCYLVVENDTKYDAEIYLDGDKVGEADAYGYAKGWVYPGYRKLYAEAKWSDSHWGPRYVDLASDGDFTWTLGY